MTAASAPVDEERRRAAEAALAEVRPGMKLGLGSGRTAEYFVRALGERRGLRAVDLPARQDDADPDRQCERQRQRRERRREQACPQAPHGETAL